MRDAFTVSRFKTKEARLQKVSVSPTSTDSHRTQQLERCSLHYSKGYCCEFVAPALIDEGTDITDVCILNPI